MSRTINVFGYEFDDALLGYNEFEESVDLSGMFYADLYSRRYKDDGEIDHYDVEIKRWLNKEDCEHTDILYEYLIARGEDGKWRRYDDPIPYEKFLERDGSCQYMTKQDKHCFDYLIEILNAKDEIKRNADAEVEERVNREVKEFLEKRKGNWVWVVSHAEAKGMEIPGATIEPGLSTVYESKDDALNKLEWLKRDCINYWAGKYYVTQLDVSKYDGDCGASYIRYEIYIAYELRGKTINHEEYFEMRLVQVEPNNDGVDENGNV